MAKKTTTKKTTTPKVMGRPSVYTDEIADKILEQLATSNKGLATICKGEEFPAVATFYNWLKADKNLLDKYVRAREDQADYLADEMLSISDAELKTVTEHIGGESSGSTITDNVQRSKLMIETRKWLAMKLKPKKYGDKMDIDVTTKTITVEVSE